MTVTRFSFLTFAWLYFALLVAEFLRPGFVTFVFSPHLLLVPLLVLGVLLARAPEERLSWRALAWTLPLGGVLGLMWWGVGDVFGDARLLFVVGVAVFPTVVYGALKHNSEI